MLRITTIHTQTHTDTKTPVLVWVHMYIYSMCSPYLDRHSTGEHCWSCQTPQPSASTESSQRCSHTGGSVYGTGCGTTDAGTCSRVPPRIGDPGSSWGTWQIQREIPGEREREEGRDRERGGRNGEREGGKEQGAWKMGEWSKREMPGKMLWQHDLIGKKMGGILGAEGGMNQQNCGELSSSSQSWGENHKTTEWSPWCRPLLHTTQAQRGCQGFQRGFGRSRRRGNAHLGPQDIGPQMWTPYCWVQSLSSVHSYPAVLISLTVYTYHTYTSVYQEPLCSIATVCMYVVVYLCVDKTLVL